MAVIANKSHDLPNTESYLTNKAMKSANTSQPPANPAPSDYHRRRLAAAARSVTVDGDVVYGQGFASAVPSDPGVYLIRDLRGLLYIGRSGDLRRRFVDHL